LRACTWLFSLRFAALLGLGVSVALLHDYTSSETAFCGLNSGCGAIRSSGFGYIPLPGLGLLPVPILGILAFSSLFAGSLQSSPRKRAQLVAPLAYVGAAGALGFLVLQAYLGHFCSFCVTADLSALAIAFCAFRLKAGGWGIAHHEEESERTLLEPSFLSSEGLSVPGVWRDDSQIYEAPNPLVRPPPQEPLRLKGRTWLLLAALSVAAPGFFPSFVKGSELPSVIRELYKPGQVTLVEFFDYQCPHCRDLSPRLKAIVKENKGVVLRLGYTPLPGHDMARAAARITLCAGEQEKEWEVAELFFKEHDLSEAHLLEVAQGIVADAPLLSKCLASPRPDARIKEDIARIQAAGWEGLPTTYIGETRIVGAMDDLVYRDALRRAQDGTDRGGLNPWVYWAGIFAIFAALILNGRVLPAQRKLP